MKQIGTFPTAYGVAVPVFEPFDQSDPEAVTFDLDGTMTCAGIYGASRNACRAKLHSSAISGRIALDLLAEFGGQPVPRVKLPLVAEPVYPQIPDIPMEIDGAGGPTIRGVLDNWVTEILDRNRWCDRADRLLWLVEHQLETLGTMPAALAGLTISKLLTAVLENLGEHEIGTLEQSAFYLLSDHEEWRHAGRSWLLPMRSTWFADWLKDRRTYRRLARLCRASSRDVPSWAIEVTR
jgi:hypothetical protein